MADTSLVFNIIGRDKASKPLKKAGDEADRTKTRLERLSEASLLGKAGLSGMTTAALALGPALLPALAGATVAVAGLGTSLAAAGAAGGVFGAVMAGNFTRMTEAIEAARAGTGQLTGPLGTAARAYMAMGDAWSAFLRANEPTTFGLLTAGFNTIAAVIPKLQPLFDVAAGAAQRFFAPIQAAVSGGALDRLITLVAAQAGPALDSFGVIALNAGRGLVNLFTTFAPFGNQFLAWIASASGRWAAWTAQLGTSSGFGQFIQFAKDNLPRIGELFINLVNAGKNLAVALAPIGVAVMGMASGFAAILSVLPPEMLRTWIAAILGMAVAIKVVTVAQALWNAVLAANPIGLIIVAVAALAAVIIANWSTIKSVSIAVWGAVWGFMKSVWNSITTFVKTNVAVIMGALRAFGQLHVMFYQWFGRAKDAAIAKLAELGFWIRGLPDRIRSWLGNTGSILLNAGRAIIQGLISGISGMIGALRSKLSSITSLIPDWKGPAARDARLLFGSGQLIMGGLSEGILSQLPSLRATLGTVTDTIGVGGTGSLALAGSPSASSSPTLFGGGPGSMAGRGGGGGSTTLNVYMPPGSDGDDVVRALQKYEKRNGPGWRS